MVLSQVTGNRGQVVRHSRTKGETTSQATSKAFSQTTEGIRREQSLRR